MFSVLPLIDRLGNYAVQCGRLALLQYLESVLLRGMVKVARLSGILFIMSFQLVASYFSVRVRYR